MKYLLYPFQLFQLHPLKKKNEKFVEQNAEEKPAKKKGRPKTKDVGKTKSDKKIEATDSKEHSEEEFGVTIDQINVNADTVSMVIVEGLEGVEGANV